MLQLPALGSGADVRPSRLAIARTAMLAVLLLGSAGCGLLPRTEAQPAPSGAPGEQNGAIAVDVERAEIGALEEALVYTGTTAPVRQVSLRAQVEGKLLNLTVDVGDLVEPGQLLAQLDDALLLTDVSQASAELAARRSEIAQAEAALSDSRTQVEQARLEYQQAQADADRLQRLLNEGAIAEQQAELAQTAMGTAQQAVRSAEERVRSQQQVVAAAQERRLAQQAVVAQSQERRSYTRLTSPISGAVMQRVTEPGNLVQPGGEIVTLGDFSAIKVTVQVSELDLGQIRPGQSVEVQFDAFPGQSFVAEVTRISPAADPTARLVPVEVTLPNSNGQIGSGLLARVSFAQGASDRVVVPQDALELSDGDSGDTIFVVEGEGDAARAIARQVQIGAQANGQVEIRSGLEPGEPFVVRSSGSLQDGQPVRLSILSQSTADSAL